MKAALIRHFGGPEVIEIEDIAEPKPNARDVLIKVAACGIDYHDLVTRSGVMRKKTRAYRGAASSTSADIEFPLVLGLEISGEVVAVGEEVKEIQVGDRVATLPRTHHCGGCLYCRTGREENCPYAEFLGHDVDGGYAEYVTVQYDSVVRVPDNVGLVEASLAGACIGTVVRAVYDIGDVRPGESVLVTGAGGGLGSHAVQLAKAAGAEVLAATSSKDKVPVIRDLGADHVLLYDRSEGFGDMALEVTKGRGVDVVIDTVGSAVFKSIWRAVADYGRLVFVGEVGSGKVELRPALIFLKRVQLLGSYSPGLSHLHRALRLMELDQIRPVIARQLPFVEAAEGHRHVEEDSPLGRVVLTS